MLLIILTNVYLILMFFISDYQFYLKEFTDEIKQDFEKLEKLEK